MKHSRTRALIVCAVLAALAAPGVRRAATPAPAAGDPSRLIDSLFFAAKYDTILSILPGMLRDAGASGDSVLIGRLTAQQGRVHLARGNRAEAERLIDAALRISESARDTLNLMPTLNYKGFVLVGQGRYDEAVPYYERRLRMARAVGSPGDEAWAWSSIAYVHQMKGELPRARDEYLRAVRLFRQAKRPRQELTPLLGLGQVLGDLGDVDGRRECYQRVWIVAREVGDPVNEMWAANNLGHIEFSTGDMGRALAYYRRAWEIGRETGSARGRIQPAINYALANAYVGRSAMAESVLVDARAVVMASGNTEFMANVEVALAQVYNARGRHRAAAAISREVLRRGGNDPRNDDEACMALATALGEMDSLPAAEAVLAGHFDRPWQTANRETAPDADLLRSEILMEMGDASAGLARAVAARRQLDALGRSRGATRARLIESVCRRRLGDGAGALAVLHAALDSLAVNRRGIGTPELREAVGERMAGLVVEAARAALEFPDSVPASHRERAFFDVIQRIKARTLIERIAEPRFGDAEITQRFGTIPLTLGDLQSGVLRADELFLDFVAGGDSSYLFTVSVDRMEMVTLPGSRSTLPGRVMLFRDIVSGADDALRGEYPADRREAITRALSGELLGRVSGRIGAARRLVVSPDGYFALVPFAALATTSSRGEVAPLIETHELVMVPCAGALAAARAMPPAGDTERAIVAVTGVAPDLPGARAESTDLQRRFRDVTVVEGVADADAFALAVRGAAVVHVAAHARVNEESPWESGFWLGAAAPARPAGARPDTTALLTAADEAIVAGAFSPRPTLFAWQIAAASLPNQLAVLAGCETGTGRITRGEGVLGLTAAFLAAGVPVVVSSQWPIDDRATAEFMRRFYRHLAASLPVPEALRRAQVEMKSRNEFSHPFYWAGFTVVGDGGRVVPVRAVGQTRWPLVFAGVGVVAGVLVMWWWGRRRRTGDAVSDRPENRV